MQQCNTSRVPGRWASSSKGQSIRPALAPRPTGASRWSTLAARASAAEQQAPIDPVRQAELVKGCRTVLAELSGLDFSRNEVRMYMAAAAKLPRGYRGSCTDLATARATFEQLMKVDSEGDPLPVTSFTDTPGLELTQAVLNDLWRWRRRGGGMDYDEGTGRPHEVALQELQNFTPEDIDRVTSSLLDNLPNLSDADKKEMSGGVQQLAVGAFQGAVWGSMAACALFLVIFNFLRS